MSCEPKLISFRAQSTRWPIRTTTAAGGGGGGGRLVLRKQAELLPPSTADSMSRHNVLSDTSFMCLHYFRARRCMSHHHDDDDDDHGDSSQQPCHFRRRQQDVDNLRSGRLAPTNRPPPRPCTSTNMWWQRTFLLLTCLVACFQGSLGLKIVHHSIPRNVDGNNVTALTLDCLYVYDANDVKLVVRWFHNDSPEPIYQWIPEAGIRYVGELIKPYFDLDYKVSSDRYAKFRAIRLVGRRLPVTLSGNFSCVISSIANQDSRQGQMVVYVPPQHFEFQFVELDTDRIALRCNASHVYPKPVLSFHEQYLITNYTYDVRSPPVNVSLAYHADSSFYSASFLQPTSSVLTVGTIYECRLLLPGTNYVRKKRIKIVYPTNYSTKDDRNMFFFSSSSLSSSPLLCAACHVAMLAVCWCCSCYLQRFT